MEISAFKNVWENKDGGKTSIPEFINDVKFGRWEDQVGLIQKENDKAKRTELKKSLPYVTVSGLFTHRKKDGLVKHSGFICLDFDDMEDVNESFKVVSNDPHTFAAFRSVSGRGLAVFVKVNPKRHLDAFLALERYFANKYFLTVDKSCKDITRPRFISYDSDLYSNTDAVKFELYIPKSERNIKIPRVVTGQNDLDFILEQVTSNCVDLTGGEYYKYLELGFALSEKYGESGRDAFHTVSQYSEKYDSQRCNKQFDHCVKGGGNGVTFATFLYHAKNAGIDIVSPETKHIAAVAMMGKKAGRGLGDVIHTIKTVDQDIAPEVVDDIAGEIFKRSDIGAEMELDRMPALELFIQSNYDLKRNEITRFIETGKGEEIDTVFTNSVYIKARKELDDKVKFDEIDRLIGSDFIPTYNPLKEFFERNAHLDGSHGKIRQLTDSIVSTTGGSTDYVHTMVKKWLVGVIASIYGHHSPLLLVLTGPQRSGKTEFFRRLFPEDLQRFYAESKLDAGKDDEILMTQKIMILDDEFGGKSKLESKRLKELTSKQFFTLREPYGRKNIRLKRLAALCGTSNDEQLLNDPTGNRRIIPIRVEKVIHEQYNDVDKTLLMMEAYKEYQSGYNYQLDGADVELLNNSTKGFEQVRPEREILMKYFKKPEFANSPGDVEYLQVMEIKAHVERITHQKLLYPKMVQELLGLNYMRIERTIDGETRQVFAIVRRNDQEIEVPDAIIGGKTPF